MGGVSEASIYDRIGEEGFERFVGAFYRRIPADDILGPMYPARDLDGAEERLREFLIFRFGGPGRYLEKRGHPRLKMRHNPFPIDQAARDRWMELMTAALAEAELPEDATKEIREFFDGVATFLINKEGANPFQFHG